MVEGGGQRPQERVEGATSLKIQILLPYLTFVKVFGVIVIVWNKVCQKLPH